MPATARCPYHHEEKVGGGNIQTQPGKFRLWARGSTSAVTAPTRSPHDYPASGQWAFAGGTINEVIVDVSGDPFIDIEKEAVGAFMRD